MKPARWAYLKSLRPGPGRYLHVSAEIVRNPLAAIAEANNKLFTGPQYIVGATHTYNVGRNKAKREKLRFKWSIRRHG